jgi:hypothetical protein
MQANSMAPGFSSNDQSGSAIPYPCMILVLNLMKLGQKFTSLSSEWAYFTAF